jgi:hypothetical protein
MQKLLGNFQNMNPFLAVFNFGPFCLCILCLADSFGIVSIFLEFKTGIVYF